MKKRRQFIVLVAAIGLLITFCAPPQWLFTRVVSPVICPGAVYAVNTSEQMVALTIDDGPDLRVGETNSTSQILNVLRSHNQAHPDLPAHATFFLIGEQVRTREAAQNGALDAVTARIIEEGHEIGNHLETDSASILLGDRFASEFDATHQQLVPYAQSPGSRYPQVSWFRPGTGWCDRAMINTLSQRDAYLSQQGVPNIALGSVWPYDTALSWPAFSRWFIRHNIQPGSIIILHDSDSWGDRTTQVLQEVLQDLTQRSYSVVPLSKLLSHGQPVALSQGFPEPVERVRERLATGLEMLRLRLRQTGEQ